MSVIYKQGEQRKKRLKNRELLCSAWGGPGRKRWGDTSYCVWLARLLLLIELHFIYLGKQIPFQAFS